MLDSLRNKGFVSSYRQRELFHSVPISSGPKQSWHLILQYQAMLSLSHGSSQFSMARLLQTKARLGRSVREGSAKAPWWSRESFPCACCRAGLLAPPSMNPCSHTCSRSGDTSCTSHKCTCLGSKSLPGFRTFV